MTWLNMEWGRLGCENAATVNIIGAVSPAALPMPKTAPVIIPGMACGKMIFIIVCHFEAPRAIDACLYVPGTALSASSVVVMITGRIRKARVSEPARIDLPNFNSNTKNARPNNPNTTCLLYTSDAADDLTRVDI